MKNIAYMINNSKKIIFLTLALVCTSVFAKELLPINGKPGIEYIIEECIEAGIKEIIFIISQKKIMIKNYFYNDSFYKKIIKKK